MTIYMYRWVILFIIIVGAGTSQLGRGASADQEEKIRFTKSASSFRERASERGPHKGGHATPSSSIRASAAAEESRTSELCRSIDQTQKDILKVLGDIEKSHANLVSMLQGKTPSILTDIKRDMEEMKQRDITTRSSISRALQALAAHTGGGSFEKNQAVKEIRACFQ